MPTKQATLKFRGRHYRKWDQNGVINYYQSCVSSILNNEPWEILGKSFMIPAKFKQIFCYIKFTAFKKVVYQPERFLFFHAFWNDKKPINNLNSIIYALWSKKSLLLMMFCIISKDFLKFSFIFCTPSIWLLKNTLNLLWGSLSFFDRSSQWSEVCIFKVDIVEILFNAGTRVDELHSFATNRMMQNMIKMICQLKSEYIQIY